MGLNVVYKVIAGQGSDVLSGPKNGPAQRAVLEGCGVQVVKDDLLSNPLNLQMQPESTLPFHCFWKLVHVVWYRMTVDHTAMYT